MYPGSPSGLGGSVGWCTQGSSPRLAGSSGILGLIFLLIVLRENSVHNFKSFFSDSKANSILLSCVWLNFYKERFL